MEIKNEGSVVHIRSFEGGVAVNPYTGTKITTDLTATTIPLAIDQAQQFSFKIDSVDKAQSDLDLIAGFLEQAKIGIDLAKDTRLLSHVADADAGNIITTSVATKDSIYGKLSSLATVLKKAGVTPAMKPWVVLPMDIADLLRQSPEFIQGGSAASEKNLTEGSIARIAGLDVFESNNASDDNGTYYVLAGNKNAIAFASQVVEVTKDTMPAGSFGTIVSGLYVYGSCVTQKKGIAVLTLTLS